MSKSVKENRSALRDEPKAVKPAKKRSAAAAICAASEETVAPGLSMEKVREFLS